MDRIIVCGSGPLRGSVTASGSKNASLALMAAALLGRGETILENIPRLRDVEAMLDLLGALGAEATWSGPHEIRIEPGEVRNPEAPYDLVRKMRASFLVLGPLLARYGSARVSVCGRWISTSRVSKPWAERSASITATSRPAPRGYRGLGSPSI